MHYAKAQSVAKKVEVKGPELTKKILHTMKMISDIVGATLGPGGQPILIERQEHGMPGMVTKDGVTVFRSLGFDDPVSQSIMEAARDASVRTASEAGDGTTTATVLSHAIVDYSSRFLAKHPKISPQKVVRRLEQAFNSIIEPAIRETSIKVDSSTEEGQKLLHAVARISANGEKALADAVLECYDVVGDDGNVTLTEMSGPSGYTVEKIDGFPIQMGYEESCAKFYPKFINDHANQLSALEKPVFVVYHGAITDIQKIVLLMEEIGRAWQHEDGRHNVVLVATGFAESVLGNLALNFSEIGSINVFPLLAPMSPLQNGQLNFLEDVCAITGAKLLDPISSPLEQADLSCLGQGADSFEASRFRSTIIGRADELLTLERVDHLQKQAESASSELDKMLIKERIGKLTNGIARLIVSGASNGELREKRDRAEDAICAVRGAIKHGCLPAGGWMLLRLVYLLEKYIEENGEDLILSEILIPALQVPVQRLLQNCGMSEDEVENTIIPLQVSAKYHKTGRFNDGDVYDAMNHVFTNPIEGGILDSTPAVLEAIRNSISIASLLGTLGGVVVFKRDAELERQEARETNQFLRDAGALNPADERP